MNKKASFLGRFKQFFFKNVPKLKMIQFLHPEIFYQKSYKICFGQK